MLLPASMIDEDTIRCVHRNDIYGCMSCEADELAKEEEREMQTKEDRECGAADYAAGVPRARCPFGDMLRRGLWEVGWDDAEEAAADAMERTQTEINLPLVGVGRAT